MKTPDPMLHAEYLTLAQMAMTLHAAKLVTGDKVTIHGVEETRPHKRPRDCACHKEALTMWINVFGEYDAYVTGNIRKEE